MQIQVNTDSNIPGSGLQEFVEQTINRSLGRFGDWLTRVEVHLNDENSQKAGAADKRCLIEARPAGRNPVATSHLAETVEQALNGAAEKMGRLLESERGRLSEHKGQTPTSG